MDLKRVKKISKALADVSRLQILMEIRRKSSYLMCSDICEFINLSQPSISHHIKQLLEADLIGYEKEGRQMRYHINQEVLTDYINYLTILRGR
ncbi:MAG: metalloregulator ArsR/SmtB family transcription factor [Prolixibacteraceae bacterium]